MKMINLADFTRLKKKSVGITADSAPSPERKRHCQIVTPKAFKFKEGTCKVTSTPKDCSRNLNFMNLRKQLHDLNLENAFVKVKNVPHPFMEVKYTFCTFPYHCIQIHY